MKWLNYKPKYHFISLLHDILLFFINAFILFPSHGKRIIFCFAYLDHHHPSFIYPFLEEEILQPPYVVDVDPISLPQPIHKDELCIQISPKTDQPYNLEEVKTDSKHS
jgi:hypothetical protein